jgi:hypothetical protein
VETDQPAEQPDVETMLKQHVNKDVQDLLVNLNLLMIVIVQLIQSENVEMDQLVEQPNVEIKQ